MEIKLDINDDVFVYVIEKGTMQEKMIIYEVYNKVEIPIMDRRQ